MNNMLSIVIVTFNNEDHIASCITSLNYIKQKKEIIVFDNNSSDSTIEALKKFKGIKVIENPVNLGFGSAVNNAAKIASGDNLLILNPDTALRNENYQYLTEKLNINEKIGAIGVKMWTKGKHAVSVGYFPKLSNIFFLRNLLNHKSLSFKRVTKVDWIQGSFLLMRKKVFLDIGGFSRNIFLYGEDIDLCYRLADKRYDVIYEPDFSYDHIGGFSPKKTHLVIAGIIHFFKTHKKHHLPHSLKILELSLFAKKYFAGLSFGSQSENRKVHLKSIRIALDYIKDEKNNL